MESIDGPWVNDTITFQYDELGRQVSRAINSVSASSTYDALGRVTAETNPLGSFSNTYEGTTRRLSSITYPNGQTTQYDYFDANGDRRLKEIENLDPLAGVLSKFNYTYDGNGNIETWNRQLGSGDPSKYHFGYDATDQLLSATVRDSSSGNILSQSKYFYDPAGNRTIEQVGASVTNAGFNNINQLIAHTGTGNMIFEGKLDEYGTVTYSGSSTVSTTGTDNQFRFVVPVIAGSNSIPISATDSNANSIAKTIEVTVPSGGATAVLSYDLNGNLLSDGARTFEWDAQNRLVSVNQSGNVRTEFDYDGLGRRIRIVEKIDSIVTSTKNFVWVGMEIAEERDASNSVIKRHYSQGVQIGGTNYFYTRDHLGSIREVTDSAKAVLVRYDYDAYGRRTRVSGSMDADFGFTRHYEHIESGLTFAAYRAYDSALGRWISRDPIGEEGGLNLYGYVGNNPINLWDPFGLELCEADRERLGSYINPKDVGSAFEAGLKAFRAGGRDGVANHFNHNPRYIYNRNTGWVDMQHVASAAGVSGRSFPPMGQILGLGVEITQLLNSWNPSKTADERADQRASACKREDFISNATGDVASIMGRFPDGQDLLDFRPARMKLDPAAFMKTTPPGLR